MVFVEDEDDECWSNYKSKEKSMTHLLCKVGTKMMNPYRRKLSYHIRKRVHLPQNLKPIKFHHRK